MPNTIFYGAGDYLSENYDYFTQHCTPVCIVDKNSAKHHTLFGDTKVEILSLNEAVTLYPDYTLNITVSPENVLTVLNYLHEKDVPNDRIVLLDSKIEYRKGCRHLGGTEGTGFSYSEGYLHICCYAEKRPLIRVSDSVAEDIVNVQNYIDRLIDDLKSGGAETVCNGCPNLVGGYYYKNPRINTISVDSFLGQTVCNFKCTYCNVSDTLNNKQKAAIESPLKIAKKIYETDPNISLSLGVGEITVSPWGDELFDFIREKRIKAVVLTNAFKYSDKMMKLMKDGLITGLSVSMDAGTRETFAKIKGVDGWDKVVNNLEKYATVQGVLHLKYIMLPGINDNDADVKGFVHLCQQLKVNAALSKDIGLSAQWQLPKQSIESCLTLISEAKKSGVGVGLLSDYFYHKPDLLTLENALR